jgi:DnaK suppressor protein
MIGQTHQQDGTTATTLTDAQRATLRSRLLELRAENEADLSKARDTLAQLTADGLLSDPSMVEVASGAEYMVEDATSILARISGALAQVDDAAYGLCTTCGEAIPFERLELRPYLRACVRCA